MSGLHTSEALSLFLLFSVPGIIALYFRAQFLTGKMPSVTDGALPYITLSLAYHAFFLWIFKSLYVRDATSPWYEVLWFLAIFAIPALLGILLGLNVRKGWTTRLINYAGINTVHPVDLAWDWRFSQCSECWVIVTLKDETKWYGYLGRTSFVSSISSERDIFIQDVYDFLGEGRQWEKRGSSVWIAHGEIQSIEFL